MYHNTKVDIIYFDSVTDFEMEFNLCGCCRMRLLTDKTSDKKSFIHMLARGVSRSRIIFIIGRLFGDDNIIEMSAQAIGKKIVLADNKKFGISSDDDIQIIDNSTPLVTSEGYYGGCIIESGPQTMILLSENKNIRKNIMNTLIHPYIKEISDLELKNLAENQKEQAAKDVEEIIEDNSYILPSEESDENVSVEGNMEYIEYSPDDDEENVFPIEDDTMSSMLIVESDDIVHTNESYFDESAVSDDIKKYFISKIEDEDDYAYINRPRKSGLNRAVNILTILLIVILLVLCFTVFCIPMITGSSPIEFINDTVKTLIKS